MAIKPELVIAHLYAREMNIYGDRGNIITLTQRLKWRGINSKVIEIMVGDKFDFRDADIVFAGGGQDKGQIIIGPDLLSRKNNLQLAADENVPMLVICGTYQLFGKGFTTLEGQEILGIGIFKANTIGSTKRMIGNVVVDSFLGRLVGFENHSGQTLLEKNQSPLGRVEKGFGNNDTTKEEGAIYKNVIGTYLHGPILPKNPRLADYLILQALQKKYGTQKLTPLDDTIELKAQEIASSRPR